MSPVVTGLSQPRGMAFDDAGNLYVAEAGARKQEADAAGAADNNFSGRVLRITPDHAVSTVMDHLPYTYLGSSGDVGATDVAILQDKVYVLTGEGFDSNLSRRVLRVVPGGRAIRVANLLDFVAKTEGERALEVGRIKANPYAMVATPDHGAFYVSDGASGRVLRVALDGEIEIVAQLPGTPPLTGLALGPDGRLYVTVFSPWPHTPGAGAIWVIDDANGGPRGAALEIPDLTMPIDVGFDRSGTMYVLEFSNGKSLDTPYAPSSGRLVRLAPDGVRTVALDGLNYPTAMVFSAAGDLYIATGGAFTAAGQGAIVRIGCRDLGDPKACGDPAT